MHPAVAKLLSISGQQIGGNQSGNDRLGISGPLSEELAQLLHSKNGLFAFDSALLVRPLLSPLPLLGLLEWNAPTLWKRTFGDQALGTFFFAEDIFGGQFGICQNRIHAFDPETGSFGTSWPSLGAWEADILRRPNFWTGHSLAQSWQIDKGSLAPGLRLLPKTPFVCGGEYSLANLYPLEDVKGMQFRASIATQLRDVPDGAQIVIRTEKATGGSGEGDGH